MTAFRVPSSPWDGVTDFTNSATTGPGNGTDVAARVGGDAGEPIGLPLAPQIVGVTAGLGVIAPSPTKVTTATSPLVIDLDWDQSVASAPAGFMSDIIAAAQY